MRIDRLQWLPGAVLFLILGACTASGGNELVAAPRMNADAPAPTTNAGTRLSQPASRGFRFADTHCSACHAVGKSGISPNPEAPTFAAVVNTPELTPVTLTTWLRNSHNFPEMMSFEIDSGQIDDLAAYMMTLRESK